MPDFINKYISISPKDWERLRVFSSRPENRRPPGIQAGMVIKKALDDFDKSIGAEDVQKTDK